MCRGVCVSGPPRHERQLDSREVRPARARPDAWTVIQSKHQAVLGTRPERLRKTYSAGRCDPYRRASSGVSMSRSGIGGESGCRTVTRTAILSTSLGKRRATRKICWAGEKSAYCFAVGPTVRAPLSMSRYGTPVSYSHMQPGVANATRRGKVTNVQGRPRSPVSDSSGVGGRLSRRDRPARSSFHPSRLHQVSTRQGSKRQAAGFPGS